MLWYIERGGAVAFLFFVFFKIIISHNIRQCVLIYFDIIFISFVVFRFLNMAVWFGLPCLGRCPLLGENTLFDGVGARAPPSAKMPLIHPRSLNYYTPLCLLLK